MSFFSGKKLLLVGFFVVLLIAIPITVYLVGQQQKTKSSAEAATTMIIQTAKTSVKVGEPVSFDVIVDPSTVNQIGYIKVVITYDPTKLSTNSSTFTPAQWPAADGTNFTPSIPLGPDYGDGTISVSMSVGGSPQNVLTTRSKIATFTFDALAATDADVPTQVRIVGEQTQVLSSVDVGGTSVLSNIPPPANIIITDSEPTDTPTPTSFTASPTNTPTPTDVTEGDVTETETPTPTGTSTLLCTSFSLDPGSSGTVPFAVNLTAVGTSSAGNITSVTFDFGDGQTQDVTDAGGIGTTSISVLASHTYETSGTFDATATLTDEDGIVSEGGCAATVTVADEEGASPTATEVSPSPLPPTGPTGLITIGALGVFLTFIGAILLLAL